MSIGPLAYELFCDAIGAQSTWDALTPDRQQAWSIAAYNWLRRNIRSPDLYQLLHEEMDAFDKPPSRDWTMPVLQSRDFLYQQIQTLAAELKTERELVESMRAIYAGWLRDHKQPLDNEEPLLKNWIQQFFFSLYVKTPTGKDIEFDAWGNDWYAWVRDTGLLGQRHRICILKTRGDFRRLLKCLGVEDWENDDRDYE